MTDKIVNYFGYGTNRDLEMMQVMIGRDKIEGTPGKLIGYELCIQKLEDIPGEVLENAPDKLSPHKIIRGAFGDSFELYITRPNADAVVHGMIWKITGAEYEMVREWELLDFGMQEDMKATAMNVDGEIINVVTHGSLSKDVAINRCVEGDDYDDYIAPKDKMLEVSARVRKDYMKRLEK